MKSWIVALTALSLASTVPAFAAETTASGGNVAVVNGVGIPQSRLDAVLKEVGNRSKQPVTPEMKNAIRERLISAELIAQEATRRGLDKKPEFQTQLEATRQQLLGQMLMQDFEKTNAVSDAEIKAEYDKTKAGISGNELKLRHILVKTETEAKDLITKINGGSKFETLAGKVSLDAESKKKGGDLGWVPPQALPPQVSQAISSIGVGKISATPLQSPQGWHVFKVEATRPVKVPELAEVKEQMRRGMMSERFAKFIKDLQTKAKIQ